MKDELINKGKAIAFLTDTIFNDIEDGFLYFKDNWNLLDPSKIALEIITTDDIDVRYNTISKVVYIIQNLHIPFLATFKGEVVFGYEQYLELANLYDPLNEFQKEIFNNYINNINDELEILTIE